MKHKLIQILLWLLALALLGGLVYGYFALHGHARYAVQPNLTHVVIGGMEEEAFLKKEDVIRALPVSITDTIPKAISLTEVERSIKSQIPYARRVNAYVSPTHHQMTVRVHSRRPILRLFTKDGAYYLDDEGTPMRTKSGVSLYLPVVRVEHLDSLTIQNTIYPLAMFLNENSEWTSFFSIIEITDNNRIHLHPRIGDYIFELLGTSNLKEDLGKIHIFYNKIVPKVGSHRYQLVKLSYHNQIVCKHRSEL